MITSGPPSLGIGHSLQLAKRPGDSILRSTRSGLATQQAKQDVVDQTLSGYLVWDAAVEQGMGEHVRKRDVEHGLCVFLANGVASQDGAPAHGPADLVAAVANLGPDQLS